MGTTADKLAYLAGTKSAIREAIIDKGVNVPEGTTFRQYASKIASIQDVGSLPTQGAKTVTPTTTEQVAVAAGRYTTGDVKVAGDANLVAKNIAEGVTIFGVTGTHSGQEIVTGSLVNQSSSYVMTIYYTNGDGYFSKIVYPGTYSAKVSVNKDSFCLVETNTSVSVSGSAEVVNVNAVNGKVLFVTGNFELFVR